MNPRRLSSAHRVVHPLRADKSGRALIYVLLVLLCVVAGAVYLPPFFARFDAGAARVRATDNLLQWGIALNLYLADNNDHLPEVGGVLPSAEYRHAWYNALPEYLSLEPLTARSKEDRPRPGMRSIWVDPFATEREARRNWGEYFFCYGMNYWLQPDPEKRPYRIYNLSDPASTLFMTTVGGPRPGVDPASVVFRVGPKKNAPDSVAPVLFADGHVEWQTRQEIAPATGSVHRARWLPFADAPDPDYSGIDIAPLPTE